MRVDKPKITLTYQKNLNKIKKMGQSRPPQTNTMLRLSYRVNFNGLIHILRSYMSSQGRGGIGQSELGRIPSFQSKISEHIASKVK